MNQFIAIVCGLKSEESTIRIALRLAGVAPDKFRIAVSGANAQRARDLAIRFKESGAKAILSVGISGALDPSLTPGDLVVSSMVLQRDGEHAFYVPTPEKTAFDTIDLSQDRVIASRGKVLGSDEIIASSELKADLFKRTKAVAVDMESHGAAWAAHQAGLPFLAIRTIADPASRALPPAALNAVTPEGGTRTLSVLLECAKAPGQFPALLQLGSDSNKALKSLRDSLGGLFSRLFLSLDL